MPYTDKEEPIREKLRKDKPEPICPKSNTDKEEPSRAKP